MRSFLTHVMVVLVVALLLVSSGLSQQTARDGAAGAPASYLAASQVRNPVPPSQTRSPVIPIPSPQPAPGLQTPGYQVGVLPPIPSPTIPPGDDIIIYIHGGPGSKLEEASDLLKPLLDAGLTVGKRYTVISFDQLGQGYSSMVEPDFFLPTPPGMQKLTFPATTTQSQQFPGTGGYMSTTATLTKNGDGTGNLAAQTHIEEDTDFNNFRGAVSVIALDGNQQKVWESIIQSYRVDGRSVPFGSASFQDVPWSDTIPAEKLPQVQYLTIYQKDDPSNIFSQANSLIQDLKNIWAEVKNFTTCIVPNQACAAVVAQTLGDRTYNTLLANNEESIIAFVNELHIANRNVYFVGGSLGGLMALRMGHRQESWIKKIVSWNPAAVWTTFNDVSLRQIPLKGGFGRSTETESWTSRKDYFDGEFGPMIAVPLGTYLQTQPNPEEWYRGSRGDYKSSGYTQLPFRAPWNCKWSYIASSRMEQQETYNEVARRWHYGLGTEELLFSFWNDNWLGPAQTASATAGNANYLSIVKPTLLMASDDDDWNEGYVHPSDIPQFSNFLRSKIEENVHGLAGQTLGDLAYFSLNKLGPSILPADGAKMGLLKGADGNFYMQWENRRTRTQEMAPLMKNTPGYSLFVPNTGHSIHNERPRFLASQIVKFLSSAGPLIGPLQPAPDSASLVAEEATAAGGLADEPCQNPLDPLSSHQPAQFPIPIPALLDNPLSATRLMQPANPGGSFIDGGTAGTYSLRLMPALREVAQAKNPTMALARAALSYYGGDNDFGNAFADLAVTGREAYGAFVSHQPTDGEVAAQASAIGASTPGPDYANYNACVTKCPFTNCGGNTTGSTIGSGAEIGSNSGPINKPIFLKCINPNCASSCLKQYPHILPTPVSSNDLIPYADKALARAYQVAWALRGPDPAQRYQLRNTLGWIAVSGEDDAPDRPVNVPSGIPIFGPDGKTQVSSYPQYDAEFSMCPTANSPNAPNAPPYTWCPLGTGGKYFKIRYTVASTTPASKIVTSGIVNPTVQPNVKSSVGGTPAQALVLTASVCLTSDGRNCLPPNAPPPPMGQARRAIVTVSSGGQPVSGAAVSVSGQNGGAVTNAGGIAIVNYNGCVLSTRSSVGIPVAIPTPCQAAASKSGYPSASFRLP
jgi:pimeloyl-ACP methyl ester carboxylesterase